MVRIRNNLFQSDLFPYNQFLCKSRDDGFQLQDICENAEQECLRNITFVRPANKQLTAVIDLENGSQIAFNHGHKAQGGIQGQEAWWKNQCFAEMPFLKHNTIKMGHDYNIRNICLLINHFINPVNVN